MSLSQYVTLLILPYLKCSMLAVDKRPLIQSCNNKSIMVVEEKSRKIAVKGAVLILQLQRSLYSQYL